MDPYRGPAKRNFAQYEVRHLGVIWRISPRSLYFSCGLSALKSVLGSHEVKIIVVGGIPDAIPFAPCPRAVSWLLVTNLCGRNGLLSLSKGGVVQNFAVNVWVDLTKGGATTKIRITF